MYLNLSEYFSSIFGGKVQKISVNASLGCPGRCTYCNNDSFLPSYAKGDISRQITEGFRFFSSKGKPACGYLAYFQAHTNTFGEVGHLISLYEEALGFPEVQGLVIATRPDCLAPELLEYFKRRFGNGAPSNHPYLLVEIGVESTKDATLEAIKRGHNWQCSKEAILSLDGVGVDVGVHLILGLPGEADEDFLLHAKRISALPVRTLKLHQLQIIKGTAMAREYLEDPCRFDLFTPERYARVVTAFIKELRSDIALDRLVSSSPSEMVLAPRWGIKPAEFAKLIF